MRAGIARVGAVGYSGLDGCWLRADLNGCGEIDDGDVGSKGDAFDDFEAGAAEELMDDGLGEAGGVVFYADGFVGLVEFGAADAVDLADAGQGHHGCLCGWGTVAVHYVKLRHGGILASLGVGLAGELFEVVDDFRVGPFLGADELAADDAGLVDDVSFGVAEAAIEAIGAVGAVADAEDVYAMALEEAEVGGGVGVSGDGYDLDLGKLVLEVEEAGEFFDARGAPCGPEVEDDDVAAELVEVDGGVAVVEGEHGGGFADLAGLGAAVATGGGG